MLLQDLLIKGYFPRELPPPFNSRTLDVLLKPALPQIWKENKKGELAGRYAKLQRYDHRRVGYLRRRLGIPNPVFYYHLCRVIDDAWPTVRRYLSSTTWSSTRPTRQHVRGRAFRAVTRRNSTSWRTAAARQTGRYILIADVSRYYPSIYTHSIPWALHGKALAKKDFSTLANLGNTIDYWVRNGQDRQTIGIPIGPDTSWLIGEIMMVAVENAFASRFGTRPPGVTIIDDIELSFTTLPEAERALAALEGALSEYELSLNPRKTRIVPLPARMGSEWSDALSSFGFRPGAKAQATDIVRYFDIAFEYAASFPEEPVIKYAVSRLRTLRLVAENWKLFQPLLLHCALVEPGSLPFVERELRRHRAHGRVIDTDALKSILETIITSAVPLGYSAEVAWSIWCAIIFDIPLGNSVATEISKMLDSIVALTALHAETLGVLRGLDHSHWASTQSSSALWDDNWLLSYEANIKKWLHSAPDHVTADPLFSTLKTRGVTFYDAGTAPAPKGAAGRVRLSPTGYPFDW